MQKYALNKDSIAKEIAPGVLHKVLSYSPTLMVCEVSFEKDSQAALHSHVHEQSAYVASGVFEFTIGDEKKILHAGDSAYMQPNIEHCAKCIEKGVLVDIFNPYREDFLNR